MANKSKGQDRTDLRLNFQTLCLINSPSRGLANHREISMVGYLVPRKTRSGIALYKSGGLLRRLHSPETNRVGRR